MAPRGFEGVEFKSDLGFDPWGPGGPIGPTGPQYQFFKSNPWKIASLGGGFMEFADFGTQ